MFTRLSRLTAVLVGAGVLVPVPAVAADAGAVINEVESGPLARTGADLAAGLVLGVALVSLGVAVLLLNRRRRS